MTLSLSHASRVRAFSGLVSWAAIAVVLAAGMGTIAARPSLYRYGLAGFGAIALALVGVKRGQAVLFVTLTYLTFLGLIRRLLSSVATDPLNDPLLLVGPAALAALVVLAVKRAGFGTSAMARSVGALAILIVFGAVNPLQGSIVAGGVGLLFFLVPVCFFWVGRTFLQGPGLGKLLIVVGVLVPINAIYGLFQAFVGFPSWDQRWIDAKGVISLNVGAGALRQFGGYNSFQEYAICLAVALPVLCALVLGAKRRALFLVLFVITSVALVLCSSRGALVTGVVAVALVLALHFRLPLAFTLIFGLGSLVLLVAVASRLNPEELSDNAKTQALLARTVIGLSDPFNAENSTASGHIGLAVSAVQGAFTSPLGQGLGAESLAARLGSTVKGYGEEDVGRVANSLGLPGLAALIAVNIFGLRSAWRYAQTRPHWGAYAALGLLVATFDQWLNGALYSLAPLIWVVLGAIDGQQSENDNRAVMSSSV